MEKIFGFIADGIKSDSMATLHGMFGDPDYKLFDVKHGDFAEFIKKREFNGLNVDAAYGKKIMPLMSKNSEIARKLGYVNTVLKLHDGKLYGDNTDVFSFSYLLDFYNVDVKDKYCVIIGDGAYAAAVKHVLLEREAGAVATLNLGHLSNIEKHTDCQMLINTSTVGQGDSLGSAPVSLEKLGKLENVIDLIALPLKTKLARDSQRMGIPAYNGIPMLVASAKKSRELFYFATIDNEHIASVIARYTGCMINISLIGLEGGNTRDIGKHLSNMLGRKLYDIDATIERLYGKDRDTMIEKNGLDEFRRAEHVALEWAGKRNGVIIVAGEGVCDRADNRIPLEQNGIVVFLNSAVGDVERENSVTKLRSFAHIEIEEKGSVEDVCRSILANISF